MGIVKRFLAAVEDYWGEKHAPKKKNNRKRIKVLRSGKRNFKNLLTKYKKNSRKLYGK
jgi:hypothetical protein